MNLTKAQLQEVVDMLFAVLESSLGNYPLLKLSVEALQHIADGEINTLADALGLKS